MPRHPSPRRPPRCLGRPERGSCCANASVMPWWGSRGGFGAEPRAGHEHHAALPAGGRSWPTPTAAARHRPGGAGARVGLGTVVLGQDPSPSLTPARRSPRSPNAPPVSMKSSWCSGRAECEDCSPTRGKGLRSPVLGRCPGAAPAEGLCSGSGWLGAVDGAAPAKPSPAPPLAACSTILQLLGRAGPCPGCAPPASPAGRVCWGPVTAGSHRRGAGGRPRPGPREGTLGPCPETLEAAGGGSAA